MRLKSLAVLFLASTGLTSLSLGYEFSNQIIEDETNSNLSIELSGGIERFSPVKGRSQAHILIPISLNSDQTALWYSHIQGHYRGSSEHKLLEALVGAGAGYRVQLNPELQVGAYGLVDLRIGNSKQMYWTFSPGIEIFTPQWHLAVNGTLPIGKAQHMLSDSKFGHEFGVETHHHFIKHQELDRLYKQVEAVPTGVDLQGTWFLNEQFSVLVGGYYMKYSDEARPGARAGISYAPTSQFRLDIQGQYDKKHTQLLTQVSLMLGSYADTEHAGPSLHTPIRRALVPIEIEPIPVDQEDKVVREKVYFYHPKGNADGADGTFEKPYGTVLDQSKINTMPDGASLYLAEGEVDYTVETSSLNRLTEKMWSLVSSSEANAAPLKLNKKSLMGRSDDFKKPAKKSVSLQAPLSITGSATAEHPIRIEYVSLNSFSSNWDTGIALKNAQHVQIQNVELSETRVKKSLEIQGGEYITVLNSRLFVNKNNIAMNGAKNVKIMKNKFGIYDSVLNNSSTLSEKVGISISGGQNIQIEENTFEIDSLNNDSLVGLRIDSDPTQLQVKQNSFEFSVAENASASVTTMDPGGETLSKEKPMHKDGLGNTFKLKIG